VHRDPAAGFALDPAAIPSGADLVVLGNPNNPSGTLDAAEQISGLCRPGRTVVVDEAFMDFVPGERESVAGRADLPGLIVVRSLTKAYGVPGVRAGYLLAPPPLAVALRAHRPPWSVNALAIAALRACAGRADAAAEVAAKVAAARERLAAALERLPGVRTWPSVANFLLMQVRDGPRVHARMLERGIAVRPCGTFPGLTDDHLRVAVRSPAANDRLVSALAEALA
jgi:histidinol-phosphate aminotransferase